MKQLAVDLVILNERASSYVQDLQIALETLVRASQSPPHDSVERRRGRVFVLRADLIGAGRPRACCRRWRGSCWSGSAGRWPISSTACRKPRPWPPAMRTLARSSAESLPALHGRWQLRDRRWSSSTASAASPTDGREYVTITRARAVDAGAVDQRHRQSLASASRSRPRAAATPGRSTAARTSSRHGRTIRSAIARARRSICATRRPASCGARPPCRSATTLAPTWRGTAGATAGSSTPRTASRSSCCSTCRSTIRSRSRG